MLSHISCILDTICSLQLLLDHAVFTVGITTIILVCDHYVNLLYDGIFVIYADVINLTCGIVTAGASPLTITAGASHLTTTNTANYSLL